MRRWTSHSGEVNNPDRKADLDDLQSAPTAVLTLTECRVVPLPIPIMTGAVVGDRPRGTLRAGGVSIHDRCPGATTRSG